MFLWQPNSDGLGNNARVLISFVAPSIASGQILQLRLKFFGEGDGHLEVTLGPGSSVIQLSSSTASFTIHDITLNPIQLPGSSESDASDLFFEPEIRNDLVIQIRGTVEKHGQILHDIELLDEAGREYHRNVGHIWLLYP
jgi:hypothetical protein